MITVRLLHLSHGHYVGASNVPLLPVAECKAEATDNDEPLYLGTPCSKNHRVEDEDGNVINKSVRYSSNDICCRCQKRSVITSRNRISEDDKRKHQNQRRLEMLAEARELGMSLTEYTELMQ